MDVHQAEVFERRGQQQILLEAVPAAPFLHELALEIVQHPGEA
ncbi:MAG TPA: hypothetical protein VK765_02395 [Solirubrobacteraceae bacterium]|nr:hypothetical protein [Solirubrobacteraceae bacterium]